MAGTWMLMCNILVWLWFDLTVLTLPLKSCMGCMSKTIRCGKWMLRRDIAWGYTCVMSWCVLDLTFDQTVVKFKIKILPRLYLRKHKVWEVDTWQGYWLGVCVQYNVNLTWPLTLMTLTLNILPRLHPENYKVWEVITWLVYWLEGVGM